MALSDVITGTTLSEIQKKQDEVKLVFDDTKTNKRFSLTFKGLLFETSAPALNKRVKNIQLNSTLGFRAIAQLRQLNQNPHHYRQLFIQMEGSNDDNKMELLGAVREYKVSARRTLPASSRMVAKRRTNRKLSEDQLQHAIIGRSNF